MRQSMKEYGGVHRDQGGLVELCGGATGEAKVGAAGAGARAPVRLCGSTHRGTRAAHSNRKCSLCEYYADVSRRVRLCVRV